MNGPGRREWLYVSLALILGANAAILAGVAWNRSAVDARLSLTERECWLVGRDDKDDTELALHLRWKSPDEDLSGAPLLDRGTLQSLGFDVSMPPDDNRASDFYKHLLPRAAFVVLEMEGPTWSRWLAARQRDVAAKILKTKEDTWSQHWLEQDERTGSRLMVVAAGRDGRELRIRYPDRSRYLILPAEISVSLWAGASGSTVLRGDVALRSDRIPVPLSLRPALRAFVREHGGRSVPTEPRYRLTLAVGQRHEPWLEAVGPLAPLPH